MPRIDPRLAVIMVVAVILSTLVVLSIFRVVEPDEITALRNKYPDIFVKESAQKGIETIFSFAAMSGRDMEELEIRFSILIEEPPEYDPVDWQPEKGAPLGEIAAHIPIITSLESKVKGFGGEYEVLEETLEVNGTLYEAALFDFSRFLGLFSNDEELSRWTSMLGVLRNGEKIRFFKGRTGFFLSQDEVVKYLMISHNENKDEYIGNRVGEAPWGVLRYPKVAKDDKFTVIFEVLSGVDQLPEIPLGATDRLVLQLIKGYADANLALLLANGVPIGRV